MTALLNQAFEAASRLSSAEQDVLAARLLCELEAENAFDEAIANSGSKLAGLASAALEEHRRGETVELESALRGSSSNQY